MTVEESPGSTWWREQNRRRTDPDEVTARGEALKRRLFGAPEPEPDLGADLPQRDPEPNDGPDAA